MGYVQDERYIAIEHMDVRRDRFRSRVGNKLPTLLKQRQLEGLEHGTGTIPYTHFRKDIGDVVFNRAFGNT